MNWRSALALVVALAALVITVGAAVIEVTAQDVLRARPSPDLLAWIGLGASVVSAIMASVVMRSRAKEEYRSHWHPHGY